MTNQLSQDVRNLGAVLEEQHNHLSKMLVILRQEHKALGNNNLPLFEEALQQKKRQVKELEKIQPMLGAVEATLGGVLSKTTFSAFLQRVPNGDEKSNLVLFWEKFQNTLEKCNQQNITNNRILNASAINLKQALNILRGNTDQPVSNVYGKTGQQQEKSHGHSLAIA